MQTEYMDIIYDYDTSPTEYDNDIDKYNATNNDTDNYNDTDSFYDELSKVHASVDSDKILCGKRFTIRLCSTFND